MANNSPIEWTEATWNPVAGVLHRFTWMHELLCYAHGKTLGNHGSRKI